MIVVIVDKGFVTGNPKVLNQFFIRVHPWLISAREYLVRWSWPDGREHGAPLEGPCFSRHRGLRLKSRRGHSACQRAWMRRGTGFVGSHGTVRRDPHRGDR